MSQPKQTTNFVFLSGLSGEKFPIDIDAQDRRWFVMRNDCRAAVETSNEVCLPALLNICRGFRDRPAMIAQAMFGAFMLGSNSLLDLSPAWEEIQFLERFYGAYPE